ncbi:MAG: hypothetical protein R3E10_04480 [Gemmatimonadota bacterium]
MNRVAKAASAEEVAFSHAASEEAWIPRAILWTVVIVEAVALALPLPGFLRTVVGFTALAPLIWVAAGIQPAQRARTSDAWARARRFNRLRNLTVVFLEEVKRLNWLGVDAKRGGRDATRAEAEMAAIEHRMHELITQIRKAAGTEDGQAG